MSEAARPSPPFCIISEAARRKLGASAGWLFKSSRVIGTGPSRMYLVTGAVPRVITRGPRKGQGTFGGVALDEVVITPAELDAVRHEHAKMTA